LNRLRLILISSGQEVTPGLVAQFYPQVLENLMDEAIQLVQKADIFIIVGTSLEVYPAAGLVNYTRPDCQKFLIDPNRHAGFNLPGLRLISNTAAKALPTLVNQLLNES
jgi:NAD-dependent deacetylase